jgi:hypothetical protein
MTKSHWWRVLKRENYLKVLVTIAILLCIAVPLQAVAQANGQGSIDWGKLIPIYNWSNPGEIDGSLTVNQFHARTAPPDCTVEIKLYAFPTKQLGENPNFAWNFGDGSQDTTQVPETSHSYGPGIYYPNVTVQPSGEVLQVPMALVINGCQVV